MKTFKLAALAIAVTLGVPGMSGAQEPFYAQPAPPPPLWAPAQPAPSGPSLFEQRMQALDWQLQADRQLETRRQLELQNRWQQYNDATRRGQRPGWRPPNY